MFHVRLCYLRVFQDMLTESLGIEDGVASCSGGFCIVAFCLWGRGLMSPSKAVCRRTRHEGISSSFMLCFWYDNVSENKSWALGSDGKRRHDRSWRSTFDRREPNLFEVKSDLRNKFFPLASENPSIKTYIKNNSLCSEITGEYFQGEHHPINQARLVSALRWIENLGSRNLLSWERTGFTEFPAARRIERGTSFIPICLVFSHHLPALFDDVYTIAPRARDRRNI